MHDVVMDELERHLSGSASGAFHAHLAICAECRAEVAEMDSLSAVLRELRSEPDTAPEPRLGFYNRVASQIVDDQQKEAWGLFSPGFAFFRRIAFASLLLLAGLGSYLITSESSFPATTGTDPAAVIAQHDPSVDHQNGSDRDRMLVTLANYNE